MSTREKHSSADAEERSARTPSLWAAMFSGEALALVGLGLAALVGFLASGPVGIALMVTSPFLALVWFFRASKR
jgi:hypothetical protein